jgi:putative restriction endonuclease
VSQVDWTEVAARIWEILVETARQEPTRYLFYSQLGAELGVYQRNLKIPLHLLQDYCLEEGKPVITGLVIEKQTGLPSDGYFASSPDQHRQNLQRVREHPWGSEPNPFGFALVGLHEDDLVQLILEGPEGSASVYRQIPHRGVLQRFFRRALMKAYRGCCAFSGASFYLTLEAAHIVPWAAASDEERADVRNGLLLNTYYHRIFDRGVLRLQEDYSITLGPGYDLSDFGDFDRDAIERVVGQRIKKLPQFQRHFPSPEFIRRRQEATS